MGRMTTIVAGLSICIVLLSANEVAAQARPVLDRTPRAEAALTLGLWSLDQFGATGLGGRLTINRWNWLGTEVSLDGKGEDEDTRAQRVLIVSARLMARRREADPSLFVTVGGAVSSGLDRTFSPVVGAGFQRMSRDGFIAWRFEIQHFPGGPIHYGLGGRAMMSLVVGIR